MTETNVRRGPWTTPVPRRKVGPQTYGPRFSRDDSGTLLVTVSIWKKLRRGGGYSSTATHRAPVPSEPITNEERLESKNRPVNRGRITLALDSRGLYGPKVDEALGVPVPAGPTSRSADSPR